MKSLVNDTKAGTSFIKMNHPVAIKLWRKTLVKILQGRQNFMTIGFILDGLFPIIAIMEFYWIIL